MDPKNMKFSKEHEWVLVEGNIATIGISDYAAGELGDIVYVELPETGSEVVKMESFGTLEAVKAVSDIFSPVNGKVIEVNSNLNDQPELINKDPFGEGWIIKVEMSNNDDLNDLMTYDEYQEFIGK